MTENDVRRLGYIEKASFSSYYRSHKQGACRRPTHGISPEFAKTVVEKVA